MAVGSREDVRAGWWSRHWFAVSLVIILLFSASIRLFQIDGFSGEYDEGAHLMVAWLLSEGHALYTEVASNQLPFLYQPTAWLFAIGGPSAVLARWLEVAFALVGIAAIAAIGRLLWRPSVGLLAALFLSLEIYYFEGSRIFLGSVASVAVAALALLCALYYRSTGQRRWLIVAGVIFSLGMLIKPLAIFSGLLIPWAIIARRWQEATTTNTGRWARMRLVAWPAVLVDCLVVGLAAAALPLISLILYDGGALISRMIDCRLATKAHTSRGSSYMVRTITGYVRPNIPLLLLAGLGVVAVVRRRSAGGLWVLMWLLLDIALIFVWRAHSHHLVLLDPPLALLAAFALGGLSHWLGARGLRFVQWQAVAALLCLGFWLGSLILNWPGYLSVAPHGLDRPDDRDRWEAVRLLEQVTAPTDFVVSDDLSIPFEARRRVIPQLADVSSESIGCGLLTQDMVMQLADRGGSAFIYWTNRFLDEFPVLPFWTAEAYAGREQISQEHIVYYNKQALQIANPLHVTFSGLVALEGYELDAASPSQLTLFWRKLSEQTIDYKVTLRLLNQEDQIVVQYDDWPYGGFFLPSAWPVGVLLPERLSIPLAMELPAGEYRLVLGIYDPQTLELLQAEGASEESQDMILIEVIKLGS